jgi:hypothetical protein
MRNPARNVKETIVFNLCTLYDLAWSDGVSKKEEFLTKLHSYLPDDFDYSVFKIPVTVCFLFAFI